MNYDYEYVPRYFLLRYVGIPHTRIGAYWTWFWRSFTLQLSCYRASSTSEQDVIGQSKVQVTRENVHLKTIWFGFSATGEAQEFVRWASYSNAIHNIYILSVCNIHTVSHFIRYQASYGAWCGKVFEEISCRKISQTRSRSILDNGCRWRGLKLAPLEGLTNYSRGTKWGKIVFTYLQKKLYLNFDGTLTRFWRSQCFCLESIVLMLTLTTLRNERKSDPVSSRPDRRIPGRHEPN